MSHLHTYPATIISPEPEQNTELIGRVTRAAAPRRTEWRTALEWHPAGLWLAGSLLLWLLWQKSRQPTTYTAHAA